MSTADDPTPVLYAKLFIAIADFGAIVGFGYLEVATPASVPWWLMLVLISIFSATLGVNALQRLDGGGGGDGNSGGPMP